MKFFRYVNIVLLVSALFWAGCAKKPATIKGKVTNAEGQPLAGAAIFTIPQQMSVLSDTSGNFIFDDVVPGEYSLLAKFDSDSTVKIIGEIGPGATMTVDLVIFKSEPPPPPPPPPKPKPKKKPKPKAKPKPKPDIPLVDPAEKSGTKVLHLGTSVFFEKFEVESSDGLVWTLKKEKDSNLKFKGGLLREGYFAGPYHKYWETAARKLEYDNKVWIYIHGPEKVIGDRRNISITVPLGLPANAEIDSVVVEYGLPKFPDDYTPGKVQLRLLGYTASDITNFMDWHPVDHDENGLIKKEVINPRGANRKLEYIVIDVDSDGDAYWDALIVRPLVYFDLR
ncbi:MAG: carboxypeptidase-like regulatory domain-containing protein [candidate division Zixibacteria bacterium]